MKIKTKYNGIIDFRVYQEHSIKSIFKILPLREEKKEWKKYLEGLLVEFSGIDSLASEPLFISLIGKLEGLYGLEDDEDLLLFRKIIFDSIDTLKRIRVGE